MQWPENLQLTPLHNNVGVCMAMVIYYKLAIELVCWIRVRWQQQSVSRYVLHMLFSSLVVFWPYFDRSDWSWRLNALVPFVVWTRLFYKGAILRDPNDPDVQNISLSGTPHDLLFGPAWSAAVMIWIGIYSFMTEEAAIVAAVSFGDGLAPLVGHAYGRHIFQLPLAKPKTIEGSVVGVFLGAVAGCYFYLYMMGIPLLPLGLVIAYAGIAAVVEATAPGNLDNIVAPVILHFSIDRVQQILPA
jgi:dolichol kinase